jgi:hypothetical protein
MSEWTISTLKEHFDGRFNSADKAVEAALVGQDKAVQAALQAAKEAVGKAEVAAEKRFDAVNEFRGVLTDQQQNFLLRNEYHTAHTSLLEKVADLSARIDRSEGRGSGFSAGWGYLLGAVGLIGAVGAFLATH